MKCTCGNNCFYAHQMVRLEVIVDEDGGFESDINGDVAQNIYDHEKPYGPFVCTKCGREYEELR